MSERALYDVVPEWSPERKEAFVLYRDFGPSRSLRAVAQSLGKSEGLIGEWSRTDAWVMRAAAWDSELDRQRQEETQAELRRIAKKHARAVEDTITVLMQPAVKLAAMIEDGDDSMLKDLTAVELANLTAQAAKFFPSLIQAARLVQGSSTQNVAVKSEHRIKVEAASPEELDAYLLGHEDGAQNVLERGSEA